MTDLKKASVKPPDKKKVETKPAPKTTPKVENKKQETKPTPKTAPKVENKKQETKPTPKTTPKAENKAATKPAPKTTTKVENKAETKPAPKATTKVENKAETKPAPKATIKVENKKQETKAAPKTTPKVENKPTSKIIPKAEEALSKEDQIQKLISEVSDAGWNCGIYRGDPSLQRKEYDYQGIMFHGSPINSKCAKINQLKNDKFTLDYIKDFEINNNGIYFKPNTSKIKGTYVIIMGNGAVYTNQEYARTLLKQGYEVILHSYTHKGKPFQEKAFQITTPVVGMLVSAHGGIINKQHAINFSLQHKGIETLDGWCLGSSATRYEGASDKWA